MVVFIDEILYVPLLCVIIQYNHKFNMTSIASNIPRPPLDLPPQVLLFSKTLTVANKLAKGLLIVGVVPLEVILPHTKSFLISVLIVKLESFILTVKQLHNYFIVIHQRIFISHFPLKRSKNILPYKRKNLQFDSRHLVQEPVLNTFLARQFKCK
jgi:hypothetical protein